MDELNIELLQKLCIENCIVWSTHALERIQERNIAKSDIITVIKNGRIIENYPDAFPYPACLVLGISSGNEKLHVVCGCNGEFIKIITAYFPNKEKFSLSGEKRKEKN
jgi:hypothetical protein